MKRSIFIAFSILLTGTAFGQIEISEKPEKKKIKEVAPDAKEPSTTEVYFLTNWSRTNRDLTENSGLFGDSLGLRANESYLDRWSYSLGIRSRLNQYLGWEGGIALVRNGESYLFEDTDTLFKYNTTYTYIGMPLKVNFLYGEDVQFVAAAGIMPQMFVNYKQELEWEDSVDAKGKETIKTNAGYNSFVISAVFNAGVKLKYADKWSLLVLPEYRMQLTSSYEKTDSYIHKARALGVTFGLALSL
jgi:hypothetical protein